MKKLLSMTGLVLLILAVVTLGRAFLHTPTQTEAIPVEAPVLDKARITQNLSEAIQIQTISYSLEREPGPEFEVFLTWLQKTYPRVYDKLEWQRVGKLSLLFKWQGSQPELAPVLISSHYDVVPVIDNTNHLWEQEPFSGHIDEEYVWGRGALDDKSAVIAMFEAMDQLLQSGRSPKTTTYMAITHDEELGSPKGAASVADALEKANVRLAWSLDEGSFLLADMIPGIDKPVASINVAEKGFLTLELKVQGAGGHSSIPPKQTAAGILAQAVARVQNSPLAGGLEGVAEEMFDQISRHMPMSGRYFFANRWLFSGMLEGKLSDASFSNALLRTTTAPTILAAGVKDNVLPIHATGIINFRLHPRDTPESVASFVKEVIDDERVTVRIKTAQPASPVSSFESDGFAQLAAVSRSTFGDVVVTPSITVGGTDSKEYVRVAEDSYRFNPMIIGSEDLTGFHGNNERVSIDNLLKAVQFYMELVAGPELKNMP